MSSPRSLVESVTDRVVHVTAVVPVPTARAFAYFTKPDLRGPRPFRDFANGADPLTHVVVAFVPAAAGTRVHLVHSGWRSGPEWEEARVWQERAWSGALRELERVAVS